MTPPADESPDALLRRVADKAAAVAARVDGDAALLQHGRHGEATLARRLRAAARAASAVAEAADPDPTAHDRPRRRAR